MWSLFPSMVSICAEMRCQTGGENDRKRVLGVAAALWRGAKREQLATDCYRERDSCNGQDPVRFRAANEAYLG